MSEESEDEAAGGESVEEMTYRRKYQMLLERCEVLQQDNERLINRIQHVFKYIRQTRQERQFLMDRLEKYNDDWKAGIQQYLIQSLFNPPLKIKDQITAGGVKPSRRQSTSSNKSKKFSQVHNASPTRSS